MDSAAHCLQVVPVRKAYSESLPSGTIVLTLSCASVERLQSSKVLAAPLLSLYSRCRIWASLCTLGLDPAGAGSTRQCSVPSQSTCHGGDRTYNCDAVIFPVHWYDQFWCHGRHSRNSASKQFVQDMGGPGGMWFMGLIWHSAVCKKFLLTSKLASLKEFESVLMLSGSLVTYESGSQATWWLVYEIRSAQACSSLALKLNNWWKR
jgi:hypothetical protein